jgi:Putative Actinobacterial Holin-X, holin superfamily III
MGQTDNVGHPTSDRRFRGPFGAERSDATRFSFGARPTIGASAALKAVAQDTSQLVRAEVDLAKAELMAGIRTNATGIGMIVAAGVMVWLAVQGLLLAAGFALALVVPAWASALIISVVLIIIAGIVGFIASRKLGTPVSVEQAKTNVQEDVAWFKTHLRGR